MQRIHLTCLCGSEAEFRDDNGTEIGPVIQDTTDCPSEFVFIIELQAARWLADHRKCLEAYLKEEEDEPEG